MAKARRGHVMTDHAIEFDLPEIPYSTIPCIDRLLEYCDALEVVATGEIDGMAEDARQAMVDLLSELRGYIV
jgi:hypothetical protein